MRELKLRTLPWEERLRILEAVRKALSRDVRVVFAYAHGSFVRPREPFKDLDLAVWVESTVDPLEYVLHAPGELERLAGVPVDVQVLNGAPPTFKYHVYTRGLLLLVRDRILHDIEYTRTILEYIDFNMLRNLVIHGRS